MRINYWYCKNLNISCELLTGNISNKEKDKLYKNLESGKIQIIIGTHALIQDKVIFKNLELVVVDEQHRFGVEQRKNLIIKGRHVNILAMTATPIPRTLTFAIHGAMDLSWIDELPQHRIPIKTSIINYKNIEKVYSKVKEEMDKGRFCFIVFPIPSSVYKQTSVQKVTSLAIMDVKFVNCNNSITWQQIYN